MDWYQKLVQNDPSVKEKVNELLASGYRITKNKENKWSVLNSDGSVLVDTEPFLHAIRSAHLRFHQLTASKKLSPEE